MSIFTQYPKIAYKVDDHNYLRAIDITVVSKIKNYLTDYRGISFFPYVVEDGEKPDFISFKFYDNPGYDWIILLTNDVYSIYDEWPRSSEAFSEYITETYGSTTAAMATVKYYYDIYDNIIDVQEYTSLSPANRSSKTIYEWELDLNIDKSKIKMINKSLISSIETGLRSIVSKPIV